MGYGRGKSPEINKSPLIRDSGGLKSMGTAHPALLLLNTALPCYSRIAEGPVDPLSYPPGKVREAVRPGYSRSKT